MLILKPITITGGLRLYLTLYTAHLYLVVEPIASHNCEVVWLRIVQNLTFLLYHELSLMPLAIYIA